MSSIFTTQIVKSPSDERFGSIFGGSPTVTTRAPGRINLIGEHVDYQDGLVLPAAIDRYVYGSARAISEPELRLWSSLGERHITVPLDRSCPLTGDDKWANYVFGVVAKYRDEGHPVCGFEAAFDADLPAGSGLSSSAALESATALLVEAMIEVDLPPVERALLCQVAEHEWAGVPCGIMDQLAVNSGIENQALLIDCRTLGIMPVSIPPELAIVVVDSRVSHALADGEYAKRKADCESAARSLDVKSLRDISVQELNSSSRSLEERTYKRARHVVGEIDRVRRFVAALEAGEIRVAGALMAESHMSLRDDFEVSCAELDVLVEFANDLGAIGARMMGGGFGGSTVNLVHGASAEEFADQIVRRYSEQQGSEVEAFVVNPVTGASRFQN
ncbi:MAG: galactokinase [Verrucomicrobiota bacterium]